MQVWSAGARAFIALATPVARQTLFLWGIDLFANLLDFIFHFYLGRTLSPQDFAAVQTANSTILIFLTTFAVLQPAIARFTAEEQALGGQVANGDGPKGAVSGIFRQFYFFATFAGVILAGTLWVFQDQIAQVLNIPGVVITVSVLVALFAVQRPVILGIYQGLQRFIAYGILRSAQALARLVSAVVLISLGWNIVGAILALPLGQALLIFTGLAFLGKKIWARTEVPPDHNIAAGLKLSMSALIAYGAFMSLLNIDLIWINRAFPAQTAAEYATAVLLRRSLILLPGAVMVVVYPRVIARIERKLYPDPILWKASAAIAGSILAASGIYYLFGREIISLTFGPQYVQAVYFLIPMSIAILGYSLGSLWLNLYLATRPVPYVTLLAGFSVLQLGMYTMFNARTSQIIWIYSISGWAVFVAGLLLYILWLKPDLSRKFARFKEGSLENPV